MFDLPRLSVDIDLNYIGDADRLAMIAERPDIEAEIEAVARRQELQVQTPKRSHALTGWTLGYAGALGGRGTRKVEVNFQYRVPLWAPMRKSSPAFLSHQATDVLLMNEYELAAGKLAALLARRKSRDLYDAHALLTRFAPTDLEQLRVAFILYGGMNIEDWRTIAIGDVATATVGFEQELLPLLRDREVPTETEQITALKERLLSECQSALTCVLPLRDKELAFLDALAKRGELEPDHLTMDADLSERILRHPGLMWKALNVR